MGGQINYATTVQRFPARDWQMIASSIYIFPYALLALASQKREFCIFRGAQEKVRLRLFQLIDQ